MEQKSVKLTLALIRTAMGGAPLTDTERQACSDEEIGAALRLADKHDLGQILAWGVKRSGLVSAEGETCIFKAVYRHQQIKYEYERLCRALEEAGIQFLPLKGSVIRKYYPEPWLRTSCDIDILVHKNELDRVEALLVDGLKYRKDIAHSHDVAYFSPTDVHVEMHFDLIEESVMAASAGVLRDVWEMATRVPGCDFRCEMPDSLFYFYHVAHMAKHLLNGGCGIKPFIDLWILDNLDGADREERDRLLVKGELFKFAEIARRLSEVWFNTCEHDDLTARMEKYVLEGGVYGEQGDNRLSAQVDQGGGKIKSVLRHVFLPYDAIKYIYPILQKHRWLTPVMQMHRWCRILLRGRLGHAAHTLARTGGVSAERVGEVHRFLDDVGLL